MHKRSISVVGLGYVGLPVAVEFGKQDTVIGLDLDTSRIDELRQGHDRTNEVESADLKSADITFTTNPQDLKVADFHIVAVPTPVDDAKQPDMGPVLSASRTIGQALKAGDIVVYESTVYPGATEEDCVPVLEEISGLKCGVDFHVGYSPERINPGDKVHTFKTITKVVAGQDPATLDIVARVYESVVTAGVHRAATIRVAEAAKVIENTQRDLNISLMNELALIFHRLGIDTRDVLEAAGTKWNFLPFKPGLVGGHCIGVDPYYLTHKAAKIGYNPQVILAGRRINDGMGRFIGAELIKMLVNADKNVSRCKVTVLGLSFKENVPDLRNTRVTDVVAELEAYGLEPQVHDPLVDPAEAKNEYGINLVAEDDLEPADALILAVAHEPWVSGGWQALSPYLRPDGAVVMDIKGVLPRDQVPDGMTLWRL